MIAYLDTQVAVYLAESKLTRISKTALKLVDACDLLISPMVLIELEYMYEIRRVSSPSRDLQLKLDHELGAQICTLPFSTVARIAVDEKWTRDAFDRIIVANAKANGLAYLISSDETIARHYPRTIW